MKKLKIILVVAFLISISIFLYLWFFTIDRNDLKGDMLFDSTIYSQEKDGITIYNVKSNKSEIIYENHDSFLFNAVFSKDKKKVLFAVSADGIYNYILESKQVALIYNLKTDKRIKWGDYLKYIPNSNNISYINSINQSDENFYVYDIEKSKLNIMFKFDKAIKSYCWKSTGDEILFDDYINTYSYSFKTGETKQLFEGRNAVYSNDDRYIAYLTKDKKIVVKDTKANKEYISSGISNNIDNFFNKLINRANFDIENFVFSPDNKYLAYSEEYQYMNIASSSVMGNKIYILDFKSGKRMMLLKPDYYIGEFDWK